MTALDWFVLLAGIAAIGWVNWYFFLAERGTMLAVGTPVGVPGSAESGLIGGLATATITVLGGYSPAAIRIPVGEPVRLVFDRQESSSCSEEIVLPDFGIRRFLPAFERTTIEVTAPGPGRYEFACGMGMLRGTLIAEEAGDSR